MGNFRSTKTATKPEGEWADRTSKVFEAFGRADFAERKPCVVKRIHPAHLLRKFLITSLRYWLRDKVEQKKKEDAPASSAASTEDREWKPTWPKDPKDPELNLRKTVTLVSVNTGPASELWKKGHSRISRFSKILDKSKFPPEYLQQVADEALLRKADQAYWGYGDPDVGKGRVAEAWCPRKAREDLPEEWSNAC
jgi:hypothetical protein